MKTAIALGSLLATSVLAKPLVHKHHKRDWAFAEEVDTVYTTVTAGGSSGGGWSWGSWGGSGWGSWGSETSSADAVPVVTETPMDQAPPAPTSPPAAVVTVWTSVVAEGAAPTAAPAAASPAESPAASSADSWGSTSTAASGSQGSGPGGIDIASILNQHNLHRANHSASPLTWDTNMANIAAQIASSCVYAHNTYVDPSIAVSMIY